MAGKKKIKTELTPGFGYLAEVDKFSPTELLPPESYMTYYQMYISDSQVHQGVEAIKKTILGGEWFIENVDSDVGTFIHNNLFNNINFPRFVNTVLDFIVYGVFFIEPVFNFNKDTKKVEISKLVPRHPASIVSFKFNEKEPYNITEIEFQGRYSTFTIPIENLIIFSFTDNFYDSPSILRPAYKHWLIKNKLYRLANLAVARKGVGIPIVNIKVPGQLTPEQQSNIDNTMRAFQTSDTAYIKKPPWLELEEFGGDRDPVTFLNYIDHHNKEILKSMLTSFLSLALDVTGGTYNLSRDSSRVFYSSARYVARLVADTINRYLISYLLTLNFEKLPDELPKVAVTQVGREVTVDDIKALSYAMQSGILTYDEQFENLVRKWFNIPPIIKPTKETIPEPEEKQQKATETFEEKRTDEEVEELLVGLYEEKFKKKYIETAKKYGKNVEEVNFDENRIRKKVKRMILEGDIEDEISYQWMLAIVSAQAEGEAEASFFKDYNLEIVKFVGVDDEKTCPLCSWLHNRYFLLSDIEKLGLIPPIHHHCRDHLVGFSLEEIPEDKIYRLSEIPPDLVRYHTLKY